MFEIEPDQSQLRTVMGGGKHIGTANLVLPRPGETGRLVNVAVKRQKGLSCFDESLYRNAAHVNVEWSVIHMLPIESRTVQRGLIGWAVKRKIE